MSAQTQALLHETLKGEKKEKSETRLSVKQFLIMLHFCLESHRFPLSLCTGAEDWATGPILQ